EAAQQLGWSLATLKRRLERGRELLGVRLRRRGLTLSAALAGLTVAEGTASAAVPHALLTSAVTAALSNALSEPAAWLVRGALRSMLLARVGTAVGVVVAIAAVGVGMAALRTSEQPGPRAEAPAAAAEQPPVRARKADVSLPRGALFRLGNTRM